MKKLFTYLLFSIAAILVACGDDESPIPEETVFTVSLSSSSTTVSEDVGSVTITVNSSASNDTGSNLSVSYSVTGTATSGSDYSALPGKIDIPNGASSASISVAITDDSDDENDETIILAVTGASNITKGAGITLTITDNDDAGGSTCTNDNSLNTTNTVCDMTPSMSNQYTESISNDIRTITTNRVPDHDYGNQVSNMGITGLTSTQITVRMDATPSLANSSTSIVTENFAPAYDFGIALNGVPMDPAPGTPFIFETSGGEYNWDWVFEPTNNRTDVGLDCNTAHLQPDMQAGTGLIHYHGDMYVYADDLLAGLGSGTIVPSSAVQVGWAADGYPVVYKYGPNAQGNGVELLSSSYSLKSGDRPGDGDSEPCGEYNGKYTNDYEYVASSGDLDECNGIERSITVGNDTFNYFYVVTEEFPVLSRCISGTPHSDFAKGGG